MDDLDHESDGQPRASRNSDKSNDHEAIRFPPISLKLQRRAKHLDPRLLELADVEELWYQFGRSNAPQFMFMHVSYKACKKTLSELAAWYQQRGTAMTWKAVTSKPPRPPSSALLAVAAAVHKKFDWFDPVDRVDSTWYYLGKPPSRFWDGFNPADETHVDMSLPSAKNLQWGRRHEDWTPPLWFADEVARLRSSNQEPDGHYLHLPDRTGDVGMNEQATGDADVRMSLSRSVPTHAHHARPDTALGSSPVTEGPDRDADRLLKLHAEEVVQDFLEKQLPHDGDSQKNDIGTAPREKYRRTSEPRLNPANSVAREALIDPEAKYESRAVQTEKCGLRKRKAVSEAPQNGLAVKPEEDVPAIIPGGAGEDSEQLRDPRNQERMITKASIDQIELIEEKLRAADGVHETHWHVLLASARQAASERLKQLDSCGDFELADEPQTVEQQRQVGNARESHPETRGGAFEQPQTGGAVDAVEEIKRAQKDHEEVSNKRLREVEGELEELRRMAKRPRWLGWLLG